MEKREHSYAVGGKLDWYRHYGEQCGGSLKRLKIELSHDQAIPLLSIYLDKTMAKKDMCTPMFTEAPLTKDMEIN